MPVSVTSSGVRPVPLGRIEKQRVYESTAIVQNASRVRSSGSLEAELGHEPFTAPQHRLQVLEYRREVGQCQRVGCVQPPDRGRGGGVVGHGAPVGGSS